MSVVIYTLFYLHLTVEIMTKLINANGVLKYKMKLISFYVHPGQLRLNRDKLLTK
jgi:hypothetical protein